MTRPKLLLSILGLVIVFILGIWKVYPWASIYLEKYRIPKPPVYVQPNKVKGLSVASDSGMIKYPDDYTMVLVGDSMTEYMGNSDELKGYLSQYYPGKSIEVLNYGYGATNVLSLPERFESQTFHQREFRPIDDIEYNLVLIESMGNNPLSQYPLDQGLQIQNQTLDKVITDIQQKHPFSSIVFVATIAPNSSTYAQGNTDLSPEQRQQWVKERRAYIENHIAYAKAHNIPVIDIYHASMDSQGEGKFIYISTTDHIHPSPTGILFISKQIADFIAQHNLLPRN